MKIARITLRKGIVEDKSPTMEALKDTVLFHIDHNERGEMVIEIEQKDVEHANEPLHIVQLESKDLSISQASREDVIKAQKVKPEQMRYYILNKGLPYYEHSINELFIHFIGKTIRRAEKSVYTCLYNKVARAHRWIAKQKGGRWETDKYLHDDGYYTSYKLIIDNKPPLKTS